MAFDKERDLSAPLANDDAEPMRPQAWIDWTADDENEQEVEQPSPDEE
jgi:P pilus assembly chaperone PapD